jgi:hypothetical protein
VKRDIQVGGRLIKEQNPRLLRQGHRQQHALLFAARQLVEAMLRQTAQLCHAQRAGDCLSVCQRLVAQQAGVRRTTQRRDLADGEGERDRCILRHHGQAARNCLARLSSQRRAEQADIALGGREHAAQQSEQRGLARTIRTQ